MADERNISPSPGAQGVGVTVLAVRRVAALAERALRDEGYTEADVVLQDLLAAKLVAEDALAMEEAGDPLAQPMAREALRMAKEALRASQRQDSAGEGKAPSAAEKLTAAAGPAAEPAPEMPAEPAEAAEPVVAVEPAEEVEPVAVVEPTEVEPDVPAGQAGDAARGVAPGKGAQAAVALHTPGKPVEGAASFDVHLGETSAAAVVEEPPAAPAVEVPAGLDDAPQGPAARVEPLPYGQPGNRDDGARASRLELPEVHAEAPAPEPAEEPAPAAPRTRSERGFAIPYGPATAEPAERGFFAAEQDGPDAPPAPAPAPTPGKHAAPAPASPRKPKAAKRVCAALAVALVAMAGAVGAAWWGLFDLPEPVQHRIELLPDAHAAQGRLNASEADVAPGSYQLVMNQVATMDAGSRTLPVAFENPEANANSSRLELSLDGERVAATGMVAPGFYVEDVGLSRMLPQGEHELAATVHVYSGATQVNTLSANVTVRVR